ncbi:MAG: transporter substrate-binding domain-containing protein [Gammaproteobacteria bacterium]
MSCKPLPMPKAGRWKWCPANGNECLTLLDEGKLDLMPDVALSSARSERFQFHSIPVLLSWSQIYESSKMHLRSLLDLGGKRVAVLQGSIQQDYLRDLADSFDLPVEWIEVGALEAGFQAVKRPMTQSPAITFWAIKWRSNWGLIRRLSCSSPANCFLPAARALSQVLQRIDFHLQQWQQMPDSPLMKILQHWGTRQSHDHIPRAMWWTLAALLAALILAISFSQLLRRKVAAQQTRNLRASEQRLNTILDSVEAHIYIKDRELRYQYANDNVCRITASVCTIAGQTGRRLS